MHQSDIDNSTFWGRQWRLAEDKFEATINRGVVLIGRLLVPFLKLTTLLIFVIITALITSYVAYVNLLPKSLIREPIYFDFSSKPYPLARVNLFANEKQWYYVKSGLNPTNEENVTSVAMSGSIEDAIFDTDLRYLKSGLRYMIDADFVLAKSPRNFEAGKFMLHTSLLDSHGSLIAKSSRPVIVPYESYITLILNVLTSFPLRYLGLISRTETATVHIPIMNDYKEPSLNSPATQYVEFIMSSSEIDVENVYLNIMPVLKGLTYYVYYYPFLFYLISTLVLTLAQLGLITFFMLLSWFIRTFMLAFPGDESLGGNTSDINRPSRVGRFRRFSHSTEQSPPSTPSGSPFSPLTEMETDRYFNRESRDWASAESDVSVAEEEVGVGDDDRDDEDAGVWRSLEHNDDNDNNNTEGLRRRPTFTS